MSERIIRVQPSELRAQADKIRTEQVNYEQSYTDIVSVSNRLISAGWGGVDADSFDAKIKAFENDFVQMKTILDQYVNFLKRTANAYETAQNDVNSQINTLSTKIK